MQELEKQILDYSTEILKNNQKKFLEKEIRVSEAPKIEGNSVNYSEIVFSLWSPQMGTLVVEFPVFIDGQPFCNLEQAKKWIDLDISEYLKEGWI